MSAEKNITRKDVAEKAGVSVSVVSRVLNNSGYVDKEKKKKIIKHPGFKKKKGGRIIKKTIPAPNMSAGA